MSLVKSKFSLFQKIYKNKVSVVNFQGYHQEVLVKCFTMLKFNLSTQTKSETKCVFTELKHQKIRRKNEIPQRITFSLHSADYREFYPFFQLNVFQSFFLTFFSIISILAKEGKRQII